ncbi:hypothetical protein BDN67DRAFT_1016493 [Paxillus ammoniavirescens]|nr:hypothetical protein BDN67DRAFT_1016493 [Paxillus ammoniavirescens]
MDPSVIANFHSISIIGTILDSLLQPYININLTRKEGVDHISQSKWKDDTVVSHCDLPSCWLQGKQEALEIFCSSSIPSAAYDFETLFASGSGIDLLCVFGSGRYPGINDEGDDVEGAKEDSSLPLAAVVPPTPPLAVDEEEIGLTFEEVIDDTFNPTCPDNELHSGVDEDLQGLDLYACNIIPTPSSPSKGLGVRPSDYMYCKNKWVHKQSICHLIILPNFTPKSQVCLLHVCGFTPVNRRLGDMEIGHILRGDQFVIGDLFLTLLHTQEKIMALCLLRATQIMEGNIPHSSVKIATLSAAQGRVKLSGDIIILTPSFNPSTHSSPDDFSCTWNISHN